MKHRLQTRLQSTTDDFLGDAVRNRWNAQQPRATIRLGNLRLCLVHWAPPDYQLALGLS